MKRLRARTGSGGPAAEPHSPLSDLLTPALVALLLFQVLSGLLVSPLLALFPIYVERILGLSPRVAAEIRILFVVSGGLVALVGGALCDALGRKPSYLLSMTGVIGGGLIFLVGQPAPMYGLAVFSGLMFGLGAVAGQSYVLDAVPSRSLALATACYFLTGTVGNALGSAGAGWVAKEIPGGYGVLGAGMVAGQGLLMLAAWRFMPSVSRPETPRTLQALAGGLGELLRRADVWLLLGLRFLPTVYWGCVTFLMPLLLFRLTGSEKPAGYYTSVSSILAAACQLAAGRLVDRFGPRVPVLVSISLVTVATLGQAFLADRPAGLVGFGLLGAGAAWSLSITMTTLVQGLSTEATKGRLLGVTHMGWSAGFLAGTLLAGEMARLPAGGGAAFLVSAACCGLAVACAAGVVGALPDRGKKRPA